MYTPVRTAVVAVLIAVAGRNALALPPQDAAWTPLFDGRTLAGWVQRGGKANYHVEDGAIVGTTAAAQASRPTTGRSGGWRPTARTVPCWTTPPGRLPFPP